MKEKKKKIRLSGRYYDFGSVMIIDFKVDVDSGPTVKIVLLADFPVFILNDECYVFGC